MVKAIYDPTGKNTNAFDSENHDYDNSTSGLTATNVQDAIDESAELISTKVNPSVIINGCFRVNQDTVSGTVTLAAGAYGHDGWKAGASGCTYTFSTSGGVTTLTISAGSLIQVIEGQELETGTYVMSWSGTAQGKIGAGAYSASGVTASVTGGVNLNIEFGTGTLSRPKLELGTTPTPFRKLPIDVETKRCQRYQYKNTPSFSEFLRAGQLLTNAIYFDLPIPTAMRVNPTIESYAELKVFQFGSATEVTGFTFSCNAGNGSVRIVATKTAHGLTDAVLGASGVLLNSNM